tara:strand:- start:5002 stop:5610 length:609 start_codon:yes stop_codon:yes gene_type:complete
MGNIDLVCVEGYLQRKDIRQRVLKCFHVALNDHSRVFVVRLDIRFPQGFMHDGSNSLLSELLRRVKIHYSYEGDVRPKVSCEYVWVREQHRSETPHYHLLLLLGGSEIQNGWGVRSVVAGKWSRLLKGDFGACIHLCPPAYDASGILIQRPTEHAEGWKLLAEIDEFEAAHAAAFNWACYLAKIYTKGSAPHGVREFGSSQF